MAHSGVKHLEEIRQAGLELPDVDRIEVCVTMVFIVSRWEPKLREHWYSFSL